MSAKPRSISPLPDRFADERGCAEYLIALRWPDGFTCPRCGSRRAARLQSRADTFDCAACGHQTSVSANTVMHGSKLPLRQWFQAMHEFAVNHEDISVAGLGRSLGIGRNSASLLKKKLDRLFTMAQSSMLRGRIAIADAEVWLGFDNRPTLIVLLEENSGHVRASMLPDRSIITVEQFLAANVSCRSAILSNGNRYRSFDKYQSEFMGSGETWQSLEAMVLRIEHFLRQHEAVNPGDLAKMLRHYVDQRNHRLPARPVSFESLVRLIVTEKPKSYWEMLDRPNPRKGRPTPRRSPRRRKTAYGLRQDGSGKPTAPGSTPAC